LGNFALVGGTETMTDLDQVQEMLIGVDLIERYCNPRLVPSDLKVGIGGIGGYRDSRAGIFGFGYLYFITCRRGSPAKSPSHIDFPARDATYCVFSLIAIIAR
jgi:hypothetical protein